jgi:hypothetical protein
LHFHFNQLNPEIIYFNCPGNNASGYKSCPSTHYVRADFLEQVVLKDIRRIIGAATIDEEAFAQRLMEQMTKDNERSIGTQKERLAALTRKYDELDMMARKTYEDCAKGHITDERMAKLMEGFESDQATLATQIASAENHIAAFEDSELTVEHFLTLVRNCTKVKKLTKAILNRFVDHIVIHQAERQQGRWLQSVDIYYSCVGKIDLPAGSSPPAPEVSMQVRKGVSLEYAPAVCAA